MAENQTDTAVADEASAAEEFQYQIKIEDAGPATKKVVVQIPKERVAEKLTEQFKEIRQQAAIPGFRPGHAPQKLVEKRFGDDVKDQVRRSLLSESYQQAVEKNSLNVIGDFGSDRRSGEFPDVPTISESGVPGFEAKSWFGLVAPAGTPPEIIKKINEDVTKVISDPAFARQYLAAQGLVPITGSPEEFATFIRAETKRWGKVVKDANIQLIK